MHQFRTHRAASLAFAGALALLGIAPAASQSPPVVDPQRGTILIHGNYCGPGNRAPRPPIDALDLACLHHDSCSPPRGQIPSCACNKRLQAEANLVADDPAEPESVRDTAGFIADTALLLPCQ